MRDSTRSLVSVKQRLQFVTTLSTSATIRKVSSKRIKIQCPRNNWMSFLQQAILSSKISFDLPRLCKPKCQRKTLQNVSHCLAKSRRWASSSNHPSSVSWTQSTLRMSIIFDVSSRMRPKPLGISILKWFCLSYAPAVSLKLSKLVVQDFLLGGRSTNSQVDIIYWCIQVTGVLCRVIFVD